MLRGTDTSHNILTLSVNQILTIEEVLSITGITAEANTCSRCVAHVAEYHCHNRNGCSPFVGNTFHLTIEDGTLVHPAAEYSTDGAPKLFLRIGWEVLTGLLLNGLLEEFDELLQRLNGEILIENNALLFLHLFDDSLEWVDVFLILRLHAEHNIAIHLNKAAIAVVNEVRIASLSNHTFSYLIVKTEVEDGVHHARH